MAHVHHTCMYVHGTRRLFAAGRLTFTPFLVVVVHVCYVVLSEG